MAQIFAEDFEGGSSGAVITTANTGFSTVNGTGNTFTTDRAVGALAASVLGTRYLSRTFTSNTLHYERFYFKAAAAPTAAFDLFALRGAATVRNRLIVNTDGSVQLNIGSTVAYTSAAGVVPFGSWLRVEYRMDAAASQQTVRLFTGANLHGATATLDSGNQTGAALAVDEVRLGPLNTTMTEAGWASLYDAVALDDATWPGSAVAPSNVAPTANAGPDQVNVEPWATVTLTGTDSDSDGTIAARVWSQTGGSPTVTLTGTGATRTFEAPATLAGTALTFTYSATDDDGATATDPMTVAVLPASELVNIGGTWVPARLTVV